MKVLLLGGTGDIGKAIEKELQNNLGYTIMSCGSDVLDLSSNEQIDRFFEKYGTSIDILINAAAINVTESFELMTQELIDKTMQVNLMGFLRVVKYLIPHWAKNGGKVVALSSLFGTTGRRGRLPYVISKHALIGAVKTLAIELAKYNVLINAVSPGFIDTKMTSKNNDEAAIKRLENRVPLHRMGTPAEVAKAVCFLAGDQNTYITGHDLVIDGGYSIGGFYD
jgi:3-oxoacyl-[acyl-carrier protein] reductase